MKIVSLKRTKKEKEALSKPQAIGGDDYDYSHRLTFDHNHLEKMGIEDLPEAGEELELHGHGKVQGSSIVNGKKRLEVQLTHAGIKQKSRSIRDDVERAVKKSEE